MHPLQDLKVGGGIRFANSTSRLTFRDRELVRRSRSGAQWSHQGREQQREEGAAVHAGT